MMSIINDNFSLRDGGYSNSMNTVELPRHRWYYYKEGFSPYIVENAIEQVEVRPNDLIIDPFNGSGTTTLTSSVKGYKSLGIEVNPFTAFLSEVKGKNIDLIEFGRWEETIYNQVEQGADSDLIRFSTFSEKEGLDKWLFNDDVLKSFEGGWLATSSIPSYNIRKIFRLGLISSAMDNCNATKDGKCLRYRGSWKQYNYSKESYLNTLRSCFSKIKEDLISTPIVGKSTIIHGDSREILSSNTFNDKFKLCITSPPYLNTFDYTDIYRPELFLGKFVSNNQQLYDLRLQTMRSHIQAQWKSPLTNDFGLLYEKTIKIILENKEKLMDKKIPLMIQAYFEDMLNILRLLKYRAAKNSQLWIIVSNSAYAGYEVPVDLIIAELGAKAGWYLKEVGVLRYLNRRKTKHSNEITQLRESLIIFSSFK